MCLVIVKNNNTGSDFPLMSDLLYSESFGLNLNTCKTSPVINGQAEGSEVGCFGTGEQYAYMDTYGFG